MQDANRSARRVNRLRLRRWLSRLLIALAVPAGVLLALVTYAFLVPIDPLEERARPGGSTVLASDGRVLFTERAEGLRIPVTLEEVAPIVIDATIAAEDERFVAHPGFDPIAIARAVVQFRDQRSGASTITQQLARRLYLEADDAPVLLRKARELLLATQLEARYSKDELLDAYLNDVYYGRNAYGIEAAARTYFGVGANELDLAQASFLAGLPQLPGLFGDPAADGAARERQRYVLDRLEETGAIDEPTRTAATAVPLAFADIDTPVLAPHFTGFVYDELARVAPNLVGRDGLLIETTLDAALQADAERSAELRIAALADHEAGNAAVVALDTRTGAVLALVGSVDFDAAPDGQNNLALALRQPGSTLKPFLYLAALERGYTVATPLLDVPSTFSSDGGIYEPVNYDLKFRGPVPLRTALASSLNVPAVRTLDAIGIDAFSELAHRVGLRSLEATEAYGLALTLGGGEVALLDLTAAYGALAADGRLHEPHAIARVRDAATGAVLYERSAGPGRAVVDEVDAFLIRDVLADPLARIPAFGQGSVLETPYGAAVKTGTSSLFRDSWTVGFTSQVTVGVWVGNPDGRPMVDLPGAAGAAPIWRDVMSAAERSRPSSGFEVPPDVVRADVCAPTGLAPGANCALISEDWFALGTAPGATERYFVAAGATVAERPAVDAQPWALDAAVATAPFPTAGPGAGNESSVAIVHPAPGSVLYLAPEFGGSEALLRAAVPPGTVRVTFSIDGESVGEIAGDDARLRWVLTPGAHALSVAAILQDGSSVDGRATFEVR